MVVPAATAKQHSKSPDSALATDARGAEIAAGADVIKLFPTGGILGTGAHGYDVVMSAAEIGAAIDEAHAHGLLVGAHVHGPPGIEMVLDAGIDTIEHTTGITDPQIERVIEQGVALVPTLAGIHRGFLSLYRRGKTSRMPRIVAGSSFRKNPIVQAFLK